MFASTETNRSLCLHLPTELGNIQVACKRTSLAHTLTQKPGSHLCELEPGGGKEGTAGANLSCFSPTSSATCTFQMNTQYCFPKTKYSGEGEYSTSMKQQCQHRCRGTGPHYWPCQSFHGLQDGRRGKAVWRHRSCPPRQHLR